MFTINIALGSAVKSYPTTNQGCTEFGETLGTFLTKISVWKYVAIMRKHPWSSGDVCDRMLWATVPSLCVVFPILLIPLALKARLVTPVWPVEQITFGPSHSVSGILPNYLKENLTWGVDLMFCWQTVVLLSSSSELQRPWAMFSRKKRLRVALRGASTPDSY